MWPRVLVSGLLLLWLTTTPAPAQEFGLPADDSDLEAVIQAASAYKAAANCTEFECPKTDCAAAKEALQALLDMEAYLNALVEALGAANGDFLAQYRNVAQANITDGEQLARTIWAIGVHEALQNFGSALLSIASVASFAKDFATNPKAFEDLSPVEMLDRLNSWASALRSTESAINTLAKAQGAKTATPITGKFDLAGGVDTKSINDQISTINDVKKTINAAIKNGKDWRAALTKSGGAAALGQIAGRFLKLYSEQLLNERKGAQDELLRDLGAGDLNQAQAFKNLQRAQARRFLAEDALAAVREALAAYQACVLEVCGLSTFTRPAIPNFVEQIPQAGPKLSWGKALRWLNAAVAATLPGMNPVPFRNECMPAEEPKESFLTGGIFVQSGSAEFCSYNPGQPPEMTPIDDPRDEPTPDGDDPRDGPTPDGDDPRDQPTPDGDDPRDQAADDAMAAVAKAQAAYDDAAAHARDVRNAGGNVTPSDLAAWDAFNALKAAKAAKAALDDPNDAPTPAKAALAAAQAAADAANKASVDAQFAAADALGDNDAYAAARDAADKALADARAANKALADAQAVADAEMGTGGPQTADGGTPGSTPTSAPPDGDDPSGQPTITITITIKTDKATAAAQASTGQALALTRVAVFGPGQMPKTAPVPGTATAEARDTNTGASDDRKECTTDQNGSCRIEALTSDLVVSPNSPNVPKNVNITVADPAVKSFNLEVRPDIELIGALTPYVTDQVRVGDQFFITVTAPLDHVEWLKTLFVLQPDIIAVEENICGDKEPAGLMPGCPVSAFEETPG